ncbi:hypothetical protein VTK56DRAFT_9970 [Thermocarpiscus australiensis]
MTSKQLSDDHRAILAKLLQITKLNNREIAWVLNVDERTIRRRRYEFAATGQLKKHRNVSKNAEKLKPQYLEKLAAWHKEHPEALLDDMRSFLRSTCGLEVSIATISRQLKKVHGTDLMKGRSARIRSRKQREAEGRSISSEIQQSSGDNGSQPSAAGVYQQDQQLLAPLREEVTDLQREAPRQEQRPVYHAAAGQQYQVS